MSSEEGFFSDHVGGFAAGSIDILHIDGTHTYEAVKEDFESWIDKVSEGGVVLFHDVAVTGRPDYGVWKFWSELKADFDCFEFSHCNGLGVLFKGGLGVFPPALQNLEKQELASRLVFELMGNSLVAEKQLDYVKLDLKAKKFRI